jgi:hypothetical protein
MSTPDPLGLNTCLVCGGTPAGGESNLHPVGYCETIEIEEQQMSDLVRQYTVEIKALVSRTAQDILTIGCKLREVKGLLNHGQWERWLHDEFQWSATSAKRMMQVAARFKSANLVDLPIDPSALYVLAAPSTPEVVVKEAVEAASQGEVISHMRPASTSAP